MTRGCLDHAGPCANLVRNWLRWLANPLKKAPVISPTDVSKVPCEKMTTLFILRPGA